MDNNILSLSILRDVIASRCYQYRDEEFTLSSGIRSHHYFDMKAVTTDPEILPSIVWHFHTAINTCGIFSDVNKNEPTKTIVCGMTHGPDPILYGLALRYGYNPVVIRKETKNHGTEKRIIGSINRLHRIFVIDDVVSTGDSALEAVQVIKNSIPRTHPLHHAIEYEPIIIISLLDREERAMKQNFPGDNKFYSLFKMSDFVKNK